MENSYLESRKEGIPRDKKNLANKKKSQKKKQLVIRKLLSKKKEELKNKEIEKEKEADKLKKLEDKLVMENSYLESRKEGIPRDKKNLANKKKRIRRCRKISSKKRGT